MEQGRSKGGALDMRTAVFTALCLAVAQQQPMSKEQWRQTKDAGVASRWIYDDLPAGVAEAKKSGKPLLIAFR
jgi:hypothetical protein